MRVSEARGRLVLTRPVHRTAQPGTRSVAGASLGPLMCDAAQHEGAPRKAALAELPAMRAELLALFEKGSVTAEASLPRAWRARRR